MFTDLVGSTSMRVGLGEERADSVRRLHDDLVRSAVVRHRGSVVKGGGDGVMASFDAASDAVAAAVSIQQALWSFNQQGHDGGPLEVRVGLSVVDVSWEGGDCFGLPVIEAARLQAAGAGGQIICSHLVELMAGGRGGFDYRPLGALPLAGLPEPVRACEVVWSPPATIAALSARLPGIVERTRVGVFVGRERERASLDRAFEAAAGGRPTVVLLGGEPGIGKTRLACEATAAWVEGGHAVALASACAPDVNLPYQPVIEAIEQLVDMVAADQVGAWVGPDARALTLLVPAVAGDVGTEVPLVDRREELFRAVEAIFAGASAATTVVLVLDDLHWAPSTTLSGQSSSPPEMTLAEWRYRKLAA
jgi:class 3 adenylate cyclase